MGCARELGKWCHRSTGHLDTRTESDIRDSPVFAAVVLCSRGGITMRSICKRLVKFLKREDGPTAVEYAVMLALIVVVCIAAITTLGSNANETFSFVGSSIKP